MKKVLKFYILYRVPVILFLIVTGILLYLYVDKVTAWICFVLAAISLLLYFMLGTMRLVQEAVTEGDVDKAQEYLKQIRFPRLLFKPVRQAYYMLQSNMALASNDLSTAEQQIRKSLKTNSTLAGDAKGVGLMQLGFIELRKGNTKEARKYLIEAIQVGIPDRESLAATHLQLCSIEAQRQQFRIAKEHFRKAKACNPRTEELVSQIRQLEKQIARLPG